VRAAAVTSALPPFGGGDSTITVPGATPGQPVEAQIQFCSESLFEILGRPMTAGATFSAPDVTARRQVTVINETFAKVHFAGVNPLGRRIGIDRLGTGPAALPDPTFEVVGVVEDIANAGFREKPVPQMYLPYSVAGGQGTLLLRFSGDLSAVTASVREEVRAVNPQVALVSPATFETRLLAPFSQQRFSMFVLVIFAGTGLGLVALGVYGVISYTVSQQTREIAVRMALGGQRRHVLGQVLRMTLWLVGTGIVLGVGAGIATNRIVASRVAFRGGAAAIGPESGGGIAAHDPLTIAVAAGLVLFIGICACVIPARRALRVQPIAALREE
jgi:putative ABC transport system permease protein